MSIYTVRSEIEVLSVCRPPASVKIYNGWMILMKFIVHSASHQANTNSCSQPNSERRKGGSWDEFRTGTNWKIFIKFRKNIMHMDNSLSS